MEKLNLDKSLFRKAVQFSNFLRTFARSVAHNTVQIDCYCIHRSSLHIPLAEDYAVGEVVDIP